MFFNIVSIFPEIITDYIQHGLFSKALQKDLVQLKTWNPREFSKDKNGRIDDKPFGGGRGMLFQAEPIINTVEEIKHLLDWLGWENNNKYLEPNLDPKTIKITGKCTYGSTIHVNGPNSVVNQPYVIYSASFLQLYELAG